MTVRPVAGGALLTLASLLISTSSVSAASPSLSLSKPRVRAGYGVTIKGAHFRSNSFVAILFAYPSLGKHSFQRFVGNAHASGQGTFRLQVQIPRLSACGHAMLYGQVVGTSKFVGKRITLVGCKQVKRPPKPNSP